MNCSPGLKADAMARRRIPAGEIGSIQITKLKGGVYRARARARDDADALHQLRAGAETEVEARAEIQRRANWLGSTSYTGLTRDNTIDEACLAWVESVRVRAQTGSLSYSTFESYEATTRLTIIPRCGGITLGALTVGRCGRIIQGILLEKSLSAARRARSVLGLVCGCAVRDDAIPSNPVRDVQRLPQSPKKTSILTPDQVTGVRGLMESWRENSGMGPRPNYRALIDGMDIMLGTSARIGECLGLRRRDVDMTTAPPTLSINGTIVQNREQGVRRKDSTKRTRQIRRVALPVMAAVAARRRLALAGKGPDALLCATKSGAPLSVSNDERLLCAFIDDNRDELITRANYVVRAEQVDPITVDILDEILGN